jgi:hypothetical protein
LYNFDLQLPLDNGKGSMLQIKNSELKTYTSKYFKVSDDQKSVTMFAPETGFVSDNGGGPRCELTEPNDYFTFSGKHILKFTHQVLSADPGGSIAIAQVKGDSYNVYLPEDRSNHTVAGGCLIVGMMHYNAKTGYAEAEFKNRDCNAVSYNIGKFSFGEKIEGTMVVDGYDVSISTQKGSASLDYTWWKGRDYGMHFKVGVYAHGTGKDSSKGGKTMLSGISISHSTHN